MSIHSRYEEQGEDNLYNIDKDMKHKVCANYTIYEF